jgi:GNAT superfamily N-acetyltransferase
MELWIETVTDSRGTAASAELCSRVFEYELGLNSGLAVDPLRGQALLARLQPNGKPVGTLTVLDTSGDRDLHAKYGLTFRDSDKVARYTRLAVLSPYRGMGISLRLMREARRRFVLPERFDYTWLLFDAERAASSTWNVLLDFIPGDTVFETPWGRTRVMVKREPQAGDAVVAQLPGSAYTPLTFSSLSYFPMPAR